MNNIELGLKGDVQLLNSSLAIQIAKYWIEKRNNSYLDRFKWVRENTINGGLLPILRPFRIDDNFKNGILFFTKKDFLIYSNLKLIFIIIILKRFRKVYMAW